MIKEEKNSQWIKFIVFFFWFFLPLAFPFTTPCVSFLFQRLYVSWRHFSTKPKLSVGSSLSWNVIFGIYLIFISSHSVGVLSPIPRPSSAPPGFGFTLYPPPEFLLFILLFALHTQATLTLGRKLASSSECPCLAVLVRCNPQVTACTQAALLCQPAS